MLLSLIGCQEPGAEPAADPSIEENVDEDMGKDMGKDMDKYTDQEVNNMDYDEDVKNLVLSSNAFEQNGMIPEEYTCKGKDVSPPLAIEGIPRGAKSLALIVDDPDAPGGNWDHWIVFNMDPKTAEIPIDSVPGTEAMNDFGKKSYGGPCPPSGIHRYVFKAYALDTMLDAEKIKTKKDRESQMKGHILAKAELVGRFTKG